MSLLLLFIAFGLYRLNKAAIICQRGCECCNCLWACNCSFGLALFLFPFKENARKDLKTFRHISRLFQRYLLIVSPLFPIYSPASRKTPVASESRYPHMVPDYISGNFREICGKIERNQEESPGKFPKYGRLLE
jgi:hypothetical protein